MPPLRFRLRAAMFAAIAATLAPAVQAGQPDSVSVAGPWHVSGLDTAQDGYTFQRMQVGETLVEVGPDGALIPGLATGWTVSEDGLS